VTILSPDLLFSSGTGVSRGMTRILKKNFSKRAQCQEAIGGNYSTKK
jgi:hypothetical protein